VDYTYKPNLTTTLTRPSEDFIQNFKTQYNFRPKRERTLNKAMKRQKSGGREIKSAQEHYEQFKGSKK